MGGDPRFHALLAQIGEMHAKKSQDYGLKDDIFANFRTSEEFGIEPWRAVLVRMNDKITRIKAFAQTGHLANEGVEDSLLDLASYSLIVLLLLQEAEECKTPLRQRMSEAFAKAAPGKDSICSSGRPLSTSEQLAANRRSNLGTQLKKVNLGD